MRLHPARPTIAAICAVVLALLSAGIALAHVVKQAGPYTLEIGWQHEPTYVGEANGVQMIVHDGGGQPISDLTGDEVKVVVSTGSQQSGELTFAPGFDLAEGSGQLGEYNAPIVPTAPGDYTFHLTGAIHGAPVDITVTSSDQTFDSVSRDVRHRVSDEAADRDRDRHSPRSDRCSHGDCRTSDAGDG